MQTKDTGKRQAREVPANTVVDWTCHLIADILTERTKETDSLMGIVLKRWRRRMVDDETPAVNPTTLEGWRDAMRDYTKACFSAKEDLAGSISARIRHGLRSHLICELQEFLDRAAPEDLRLMHEVVMDWSSTAKANAFEPGEVTLANAFGYQIERDARYIAVPDDMVRSVVDFIRWQQQMSNEAAEAATA